MEEYREKMLITYNYLIQLHQELLTRTINLAMTGELEDINNTFKAGDNFQFDKEMFRDCKDQNVNKLIAFHDDLEDLMNSLANINNLKEEELEQIENEFDDEEEDLEYDFDFKPQYNAGDLICFISGLSENRKTIIGVISNVPLTYKERKKKGMKTEYLDSTDQVYNIEYLNDCGVLEHEHISEENLELYQEPLPTELIFLQRLAQHFSGEKPLQKDLLISMMQGEIYLLNKKTLKDIGMGY